MQIRKLFFARKITFLFVAMIYLISSFKIFSITIYIIVAHETANIDYEKINYFFDKYINENN